MELSLLDNILEDQLNTHKRFVSENREILVEISMRIADTLQSGSKLILFGNGGSASDADHVVGEFIGRFLRERRPFPAISLTSNSAALTAIANDYGFEKSFARQLQGLANKGDTAVGISTSGNSENVINALKRAKVLGLGTIGFTGENNGDIVSHCDHCFQAPSKHTPRIQEIHICAWHVICDLVEAEMVVEG